MKELRSTIARSRMAVVVATMITATTLLSGCSSSETTEPETTPTVEEGMDMNISAEQEAFLADLIAVPLPQDEATAMIESAGYVWRLGTIDGEPQAVTMDYRTDRLTLTVDEGLVTDASWG